MNNHIVNLPCADNDLRGKKTFLYNFLFLLGLSEYLIFTCPSFLGDRLFFFLNYVLCHFLSVALGSVLSSLSDLKDEVTISAQVHGTLVFGWGTNRIRVKTEHSFRSLQLGHHVMVFLIFWGQNSCGPLLIDLFLLFPTIMIFSGSPGIRVSHDYCIKRYCSL